MRNFTVQSILSTIGREGFSSVRQITFAASLTVLFLGSMDAALAQCTNNGVNLGTRTPNCSWQTQSIGPDNEVHFSVVSGRSYTFSFCNGGGSRGNWDTQLTGFNGGSASSTVYNDDAGGSCGVGSEITWTANFTGSLQLNADVFNCGSPGWFSGATSSVLAYRENSQSLTGGTLTADGNSSSITVCEGEPVTFNVTGFQQNFVRLQYRWNGTGSWIDWSVGNGGNWNSNNGGGSFLQVRAQISNNSTCDGFAYSNSVNVNVNDNPSTPSVTGGGATICVGGSRTFTASSSGGVSCSWQWQRRPGTSGGWTNVGTNSSSYNTGTGLTAGTWQFRAIRNCTGPSCSDPASSPVTLSVVSDPSTPTVSGAGITICNGGGTTLNANSSNGSGCSWQWQRRLNSGGWSNVGGNSSAYATGGLSTGTWQFRVTRNCTGSGCSDPTSSPVTINVVADPNAPSITGNTTICSGGSHVFTATDNGGGTGTCQFQWERANNAAFSSGVTTVQTSPSTTYNTGALTATRYYRVRKICSGTGCDNSGWSAIRTVTVVPDPSLTVSIVDPPGVPTICDAGNDVELLASVSNGTGCTGASVTWESSPTGTGSWSTVSTGNPITVSPTATTYYRAQLSCSGTGCDATTSTNNITVTIPDGPEPAGGPFAINGCGEASIIATVASGNTARFYTSLTNLNNQNFASQASSYTITNTGTTTISQTIYVTQYDPNTGCESSIYEQYDVTVGPTFTFGVNETDVTCNAGSDGSAQVVSINGNPGPFTYNWSSGSTSSSASGLSAGSYSVTVVAQDGCASNETFTITEPAPVSIVSSSVQNYNGVNVSCNGGSDGSITVSSVTGGSGSGYTYLWTPTNQTSNTATGLSAGTYNVRIRDNNSCEMNQTFTLTEPSPLTTGINESYECGLGGAYVSATLTASPVGGTAPYSYSWSNGGGSAQSVGPLADGVSRTVTVTDANGCTAQATAITVFPADGDAEDCDFIYVSPDGDNSALALGSSACPASFTQAMNMVTPTRNVILMKWGNYPQSGAYTTISNIPSNVVIDGGYVESASGEWIKTNASTTTINVAPNVEVQSGRGHFIGIKMHNKTDFVFKDITVNVMNGGASGIASGTTGNSGRSVYGIHLLNSTAFELTRVSVNAGAGSVGNNGTTPSGSGGGFAGGGGGGGGGQSGSCNSDPGNGSPGGNGGGASSGGGFGAGNPGRDGCNIFGCDQANRNGNNGGPGADRSGTGFSYSAAAYPTAPTATGTYYVPSGQSASGGAGIGGGGGGGGSGGHIGSCCITSCGGGNAFGGTGGAGGAGGAGGTGGFGGGGSFAIYMSGGNGILNDRNLSVGAQANGGLGANGAPGIDPGSNGNPGGFHSRQDGTTGGRGGDGGRGQTGGRGENGARGLSQEVVTVNSASLTDNGVGVPGSAVTVENNQYRGCANSVITLSKTGGGLWGIPADAEYVNDVSANESSFDNSDSEVEIYFPTVPLPLPTEDFYNVTVGATTYRDYINLRVNDRTLPTIDPITSPICPSDPISFSTPAAGQEEYLWEVRRISSPNSLTNPSSVLFDSQSQSTGSYIPTTPGTYQVMLQVKDFCCGWSIPVYETFVVSDVPDDADPISGPSSVCAGAENIAFSTTNVTGITYTWTVPGGASIVSGQGTSSITVDFSTSGGTVTVTPSNICSQTGNPSSLSVTVNSNPTVSISGTTNICNGTNTVLTAGASGGTGTYTYAWSGGSIASGAGSQTMTTTNLSSTTTYTVLIEDGNGCTDSANETVTIDPASSSGVAASDQTICTGDSPSNITLSGQIGTVQWQVDNGSGFNDIVGATSATLTTVQMGSLTSDADYQAIVTSGTCPPASSNTVTVEVRPDATATISGATTVCQDATPPNITFTNPFSEAITVTYNVNSGSSQFISVPASGTSTVAVFTGSPGTFTYNLVNAAYQSSPNCASAISGSAVVEVEPAAAITSVTGAATVCIGATETFTANGVILGGASGSGSWSSSDPSVATVNASTGVVTGVAPGTADITYSISGGCGTASETAAIEVYPDATVGPVVGETTLCTSGVDTFTVSGVALGGTGTGQWVTSNASVATVDVDGVVTAISAGSVNISYEVTGGCPGTVSSALSVTVTANPDVAPTAITVSPATPCNGGSFTLTADGSASASSDYQWGTGAVGSNIIPGETTSTLVVSSGVSSDTDYWVRIVGSGACPGTTAPATVTVQADQSISITDEGGISCVDPTGTTLTATFSGGVGPCTLDWETSTTSASGPWASTGVSTSTYTTGALTATLWVRAVRTCSGSCPAGVSGVTEVSPIEQPTVPSTTINGCGAASITPTVGLGGTTIRFYDSSANLLSTGTSYTSFTTGTYTIDITSYNDVTGCESAPLTLNIDVSAAYSLTVTGETAYNGFGISCAFGNDGSLTAELGPTAVGPATFAWSNFTTNSVNNGPPITNSISGLVEGTYVVLVTDDANCIAVDTMQLVAPAELLVGLTPSDFQGWNVSCNGANDGQITANPTGGAGSYTYAWSSANPAGFSGAGQLEDEMIARDYTVVVTDGNGCTTTETYSMLEPDPITFTTSVGFLCDGNVYDEAVISVNASGGASGSYEYSLDGSTWQSSSTLGGSGEITSNGTETVYVRDALNNTCSVNTGVSVTFPSPGDVLDACDFIYVSPAGAGSLGTKACPTSLTEALTIYASTPARDHILMLGGSYGIGQKIVIPAGLTIDGGYEVSGDDWEKSSTNTTDITINPASETAVVGSETVGHYIGFEIDGNNVTLRDLTLDVLPSGVTVTTNGNGRSIYGVYNSGHTGLNISRCSVSTGDASSGANGTATSGNGGGGAGGARGDNASGSPAVGCPATGTNGADGTAGGSGTSAGGSAGTGGLACTTNCSGTNTGGCQGANGNDGADGIDGFSYTPGNTPLTGSGLLDYFVPQSGNQGGDGSGGGGGGRGGDGARGDCAAGPSFNDSQLNGAFGGNGGAGGAGGNGGGGGGSSIALYSFGGSGTITDCVFNGGAAGSGGLGSAGANGVAGSAGSSFNITLINACDGAGGFGGDGGNGGNGGRGQDGADGVSQGVVLLNGASFGQSGIGSIPNDGTITANWFKGCRDSEILMTKTSGANWSGIGTQPRFVNDIDPSTSSYAITDNTVAVYYTAASSSGAKDVSIVGTTLNDFIEIQGNRIETMLPTSITEVLDPCANDPITLAPNALNAANIEEWDWAIVLSSNPTGTPVYTSTSSSPGSVAPPSGGWLVGETYLIKLRVKETCCGWSIPVYRTFQVAEQLPAAAPITAAPSGVVCAASTVTYTVPAVAGATDYNWTVTGGGTIVADNGNSIDVTWGPAITGATVSVFPSNTCSASDGPTTTITFDINNAPNNVTITGLGGTPLSSICVGDSYTLQANANSGGGVGTGVFTYVWTPTSSTAQTLPITPPTAGSYGYDVTVTEGGSGCSTSASATIVVDPVPTVDAGSDVEICESATPTAVTLNGSSFGGSASTAAWSITSGGGSLSSTAQGANPETVTYTPAASFNGSVVLTLTTDDPSGGCTAVSDTRTITVYELPTIAYTSGGQTQAVCNGQPITSVVYTFGGSATGVSVTNLPSGLSSSVVGSQVTISGTPTSGGTYTISTTGQDASCSAAEIQGNISINSDPVADAGSDVAICSGLSTAIGGLASGGDGNYTYAWNNAGSLDDASIAQPTATPGSTTNYEVTVTDGNGCTDTDQVVVTVNDNPVADAGTDVDVCTGSSVTIGGIATGGDGSYTYAWDNAATLDDASIAQPSANPTSTTTYEVTVTDGNGCEDTDQVTVTVNDNPTADAGSDASICSGELVSIGALATGGDGSYAYSWDNAGTLDDASIAQPSASPTSTTTYEVTVTDGNGCEDTDQVTVTVNTVPVANAGSDADLCNGNSVSIGGLATGGDGNYTYSWDNSGTLDDATIAQPSASPTSTTTYEVTVTDGNGCEDTDQVTVTVNTVPVADAGSDADLCSGNSVSIGGLATGGDGNYTYSWDNSGTLDDATIAQPSANPASTTIYEVTVTDGNGCEDTDQVTVTVNDNPTASAGSDATICPGDNQVIGGLAVGGDGTYTYSWDNAGTLDDASIAQPTASPIATTTYEVTVTDGNGCIGIDQVTITVNPVITANAGSDVNVCSGSSVTIGGVATGGNGSFTYSWDNAATLDNASIAQPTANPTATTTYEVTVTDGNGCTATDQVVVTVNALPSVSIAVSPVTGINCGADVTLTATAGFVSYEWFDPAMTSTGDLDNEYDASSSGTYTVEVEDANGCTVQESTSVTIYSLPTINVVTGSADQTICDGSAMTDVVLSLSGSGSLTASASSLPAGVSFDPATLTISGTPASGGPYTYTITTSGQPSECPAGQLTGTLTLSTAPTASVDAGTTIDQCNSGSPVDIDLVGSSFGGTATGASWSIVSGGGSLSTTAVVTDPTSVVYTPAVGYNGAVILELTTEGSDGNCSIVSDQVTINLSTAPSATVDAGSGQSICESTTTNSIILSGAAFTGTATDGQWSVVSSDFTLSGTELSQVGFVSDPSTVTFDVPANVSGDVILELTTQGTDGNCSVATDQVTISVIETPTPIIGSDITVCESNSSQVINLSGALLGAAANTSWAILSDPIGVLLTDPSSGDPSQASITVPANTFGTVTLELTGQDVGNVCSSTEGPLTVTINEAPTVFAGLDNSVCSGFVYPPQGFLGGSSIGGSATEAQWTYTSTPTATITFSDPGYVADPSSVLASAPLGFIGTITLTSTTDAPAGCIPASDNLVVSLVGPQPATTWEGDVSSDWHDNDNWTNCVPGPITVTTINDLVGPNDPVISVANADVFTIQIDGTSVLEIQDTPVQRVLTVHGP